MATPQKAQVVRKPLLGVFPVDRDHVCTPIAEEYRLCLREHDNDTGMCRELGKKYLVCRMDNNLMERMKLSELGFQEDAEEEPIRETMGKTRREEEGFTAGTSYRRLRLSDIVGGGGKDQDAAGKK